MRLISTVIILTMVASNAMAWTNDPHADQRGKDHWKMQDCQNQFVARSTGTIAKHCNRYIPSRGVVSRGKHEGKQWQKAFRKSWFIDPNENSGGRHDLDIYMHYDKDRSKFYWAVNVETIDGGRHGKGGWSSTAATKQIAKKHILNHIRDNGINVETAFTKEAKKELDNIIENGVKGKSNKDAREWCKVTGWVPILGPAVCIDRLLNKKEDGASRKDDKNAVITCAAFSWTPLGNVICPAVGVHLGNQDAKRK